MRAEGTVAEVLAGEARYAVAWGDALAFLRALPDGCVNLHWIDPPYFRVVDEAWDRAWKSEADFLAWLRGVIAEAARTLAPNGSLYLFASPQMGARIECLVADSLRVLNSITWAKSLADYPPGDPRASAIRVRDPEAARGWASFSERVVFAESATPDLGPFARRVAQARELAGLSRSQLEVAIGLMSTADPARGTGLALRWEEGASMPTPDDYARALRACGDLRDGAAIAAEHEAMADALARTRRPFVAPSSFTDVWTYAPPHATPQRHPCEKPAAMLRDVVRASSRPGDLVCDPFGGSFRMAETALADGRRYIGCDADEHWHAVGVARARAAVNGTAPAVPARAAKSAVSARQPSLFDLTKAGAT